MTTTNTEPDIEPVVPIDDTPPAAPDDRAPKRAPRRSRSRAAAAPPAAPKRGRGRPPKPATLTGDKRSLAEPLEQVATVLGTGLAMINPVDGLIVVDNAPRTAQALDKLAQENDQVYRALSGLFTGGAWLGVIAVIGAQLAPIAANHGVKIPMGEQQLAPYIAKATELGMIEPREAAAA